MSAGALQQRGKHRGFRFVHKSYPPKWITFHNPLLPISSRLVSQRQIVRIHMFHINPLISRPEEIHKSIFKMWKCGKHMWINSWYNGTPSFGTTTRTPVFVDFIHIWPRKGRGCPLFNNLVNLSIFEPVKLINYPQGKDLRGLRWVIRKRAWDTLKKIKKWKMEK